MIFNIKRQLLYKMSNISKDPSQYEFFLQKEFNTIYKEFNDKSIIKAQYEDIINRQEILLMHFQIQKKGKKLGISQSRLLKISNNQLYQVDKYLQQKPIPFPNGIKIIKKQQKDEQWNSKYDEYNAKILLTFTQRTDIIIYFKSMIECNEVATFLVANIKDKSDKPFDKVVKIYENKMIEYVVEKIRLAKIKQVSFRSFKKKIQISQSIKSHFNDQVYIKELMNLWKSKAIFSNRKVDLQISVLELQTKISEIKGVVKIWVETSLVKKINLSERNVRYDDGKVSKKVIFGQEFKIMLNNVNYLDEIKIEIEDKDILMKTQTFLIGDLKKSSLSSQIILNLYIKGEINYLKLKTNFKTTKQNKIQNSTKITPRHYRIIDQLYCQNKKAQQTQIKNIHHKYQSLYDNICHNRVLYVNFNKLKLLSDYLKIEELINKFLAVQPFKNYIDVSSKKGTFIYQYFLKNSQKQMYYDVQRLIWKFKETKYKRMLTALKMFDQNPKFNFTQPFFYLVKRVHEIAQRESLKNWKQDLFAKNSDGIDSITFFMTMGIIKLFPNVFIHQSFINKKALPFNSLLFKYTFERELPEILNKINKIQLNIQAYFGMNFVNLLSNILQGQYYTRILIMMIEEKRENTQSNYFITIISVFLTLIQLTDKHSCSYVSAEHYIITFQEIAKKIDNHFQFYQSITKWKGIVKKYVEDGEFKGLIEDMIDFYLNNGYSGDLGQISREIYKQFTCYHYKNENEIRKIIMVFDKIDLGIQDTSSILTLTIFQSAIKLYQHEFKGINLNQLDHLIQLKLIKLQQLSIICNTQNNSYSCRLDPKEVPSNIYFHFIKPLTLTYHLSPQCNRHIIFQTYIKDSCQIDNLQNPIPNKYRQIFLEKGINKEDVTFCKKFSKTFRMRQNNFNLLYSKFGWFGNHYLYPDQRFISMEILGPRRAGQQQLLNNAVNLNRYTRILYGKAFSPFPIKENRYISVQLIKEDIHTSYQPTKLAHLRTSSVNQINIYNSASRLLCYQLDNFYISSSMNYVEFYHFLIDKLPLIRYLSYQPKQFYLLPSFTIQISSPGSFCTIIISAKGKPFKTIFTNSQIEQIQQKASFLSKLPQEIEVSYAPFQLLFDQFLYYLRLNVLSQLIIENQANKKGNKSKRWPNKLVCLSTYIPNYEVYHFYEVMNETKQIIQLEFKQTKKKSIAQCLRFDDFGWIGGRWQNVYCITKFKASSTMFYYVMTQLKRKKYILEQQDFIQTDIVNKQALILEDDISNSMEIITYQLSQMFNV